MTSDGLMKLALTMKAQCEVMVSGLITRRDKWNEKGVEVNRLLKEECTRHNILYIPHENIKVNHLNGGGLHLNGKGTGALAGNFIRNINL